MTSSVITAPVVEEIFFRGWLLSQIEGPILVKVIIVSLLFGLYHLKNWYLMEKKGLLLQVLYTGLVAGPIFTLAAIYTNGIFISILLHSLNNTLSLTITDLKFPKLYRFKTNTFYN